MFPRTGGSSTRVWGMCMGIIGYATNQANLYANWFTVGFSRKWLKYNTFVKKFWLSYPFSRSRAEVVPPNRFSRFVVQTKCFCARRYLGRNNIKNKIDMNTCAKSWLYGVAQKVRTLIVLVIVNRISLNGVTKLSSKSYTVSNKIQWTSCLKQECSVCLQWARKRHSVTQHKFQTTSSSLLLCRGYMWSKIISKLFHRLIAAHEYFPTWSLSVK